jgi:hypothetical protein
LNGIRPEWLEAVAASRWNLWLIPSFMTAPLLALIPFLRRWYWIVIIPSVVVAVIATWISLFCYSETIWETMEANAQTSAEWDEVTSDTGRVFGPFLCGVPFAVIYTTIWLGVSLATRWLMIRVSGQKPRQGEKPGLKDT